MKTVTIYTDGIKTALRFYGEMSVLLAPFGATAEHDRQAPWDKSAAKESMDHLLEVL